MLAVIIQGADLDQVLAAPQDQATDKNTSCIELDLLAVHLKDGNIFSYALENFNVIECGQFVFGTINVDACEGS